MNVSSLFVWVSKKHDEKLTPHPKSMNKRSQWATVGSVSSSRTLVPAGHTTNIPLIPPTVLAPPHINEYFIS